jgi:hypothetical protein
LAFWREKERTLAASHYRIIAYRLIAAFPALPLLYIRSLWDAKLGEK